MVIQKVIELPQMNRGFHLITHLILKEVKSDLPKEGLINIFIQHTSAGITINENADVDVRYDMEFLMNHIVPENIPGLRHILEGSDDMPSHFKSSLVGQSVTIPITDYKLNLGNWQGIYLCEFRNKGCNRKLIVTIYG